MCEFRCGSRYSALQVLAQALPQGILTSPYEHRSELGQYSKDI